MSVTQPSREPAARGESSAHARELSARRARRRLAQRRRRLARLDLGLGVLAALVLILATPGLAISALIALLVLGGCALTFILERRRRTRARGSTRARRSSRARAEVSRGGGQAGSARADISRGRRRPPR